MPDLFDVLIVGAGPAGLAAATAAATSGGRVGLVDENVLPGGQIYRASGTEAHKEVRPQLEALVKRSVEILSRTTIFDAPRPGDLLGSTPSGVSRIGYKKLILAVGARELFLPFPGWTLPNVMGVGGLQALMKSGLDVMGKGIVIAGSGPLLIAVADYLRHHGAQVVLIAEQADTASLAKFMAVLPRYPTKLKQAMGMVGTLGKVRRKTWVVRAVGAERLEGVWLNSFAKQIPCDYLACAFGFVPSIELPMMLGCEIAGGYVAVDEHQVTSDPDILCAGEPTGIGGIDLSIVEGSIAGFAATGQFGKAKLLFAERKKWKSFADDLDRTFALRSELKGLANSETVVCRCEDVRLGQLAGHESGRTAKLHTRCGMGPCQGRICGPATRFLFGWEQGSVRPPLAPSPLAGLQIKTETEDE